MTFFHFEHDSFLDDEFPVISNAEEQKMAEEEIPEEVGILTLKNTVLYPGVVIPITVGRDKSIQLVKEAYRTPDRMIGVVAQKDMTIEDPVEDDLYTTGTLARIMKLIRMPDGSVTIVIQGRSRFQIEAFTASEPYFKARIIRAHEEHPEEDQTKALMLNLREAAARIVELSPSIPSEARIALENIDSLNFLVHFIASNLSIDVRYKQEILMLDSLQDKGELVLQYLDNELKVLELSEEIQTKVKIDLDKQQREYILRQQIRTIQDELGEGSGDSEIENLRERAKNKTWPEEVEKAFSKEMNRLSRLTPAMPDYAIVINYIEWLLDLPWENYAPDTFEFPIVKRTLDADHFGLEKVKDRILEQLAVLKLKADKKAPILCFYGPPGVGKTSLGKSIANAMGKEFVRISLGGAKDEAEIRGHRRTYIGAMPGRIIQGLKKAKTSNPVLMLDEIDKVGNDFRGDPSAALLEVLDPEQNNTFRDNFLEVEYDLSRVMFICTANNLSTIHPALRDRMEIIEINGYSQEEKMEIARRHLIPKARKDHGLKAANLTISKRALERVIQNYTRESGVRGLSQQIASLCRGAAKEIVLNDESIVRISEKNLKDFLGIHKFENEQYQAQDVPGVAVGLAWTSVGGEILFIESTLTPGTGRLSMTGQLGDVMKESATLAYTYLKSNCDQFGIPFETFKRWDVHLHIPAGAIPKDGPSAGITMLSSLASLFSQRLMKPSLAMTGEITLRGKVLPVGGIQEKVLAAKRAGINTLIMCHENKKDVSEINPEYIKDVKIHFVKKMSEVIRLALEPKPVSNALNLIPDLSEDQKGMRELEQIRKIVARA
ncbi:endopeptidase La [Pontibacter sp. G13]|uniref:endopeptidase La n=1 Tax=Pontibacter sp. G13 TaxID=3074898 RepID=UPI00288A6473|nr:endopeptidase La [Pontibacter sp. G13]WNJ19438.1 endopeptidase La [Pontibacter sp. G13]